MPGHYVGSRSAEITHMLGVLEAGNADCSLDLAPPATGADGPETYTSGQVAANPSARDADADVRDGDAVERERQSRLARWQKQP